MVLNTESMFEETTIGYVYILENDAMPGLIKIGKTSRDSTERARELSATTGVPTPFEVAFELFSERYEMLEREMHNRLAKYRVASNREFFKYPVNKAIALLENLDTEKQDEMRPEAFRDKKNLITRVSNFFKQFLRPNTKSDDSPKIKSDNRVPTETVERGSKSVDLTPPANPPKPNLNYIIKDRPLQNEYRENAVEPSLNGKPYYSEENGFYWAANHQGIVECLPQHIKRIIHNEELEIASTRDQLEQELNALDEEIVKLEEQKGECEQEIKGRFQELAEKKEELAGLEVQLKTLSINRLEPIATEGMSEDSNPEFLNTATVENIPDNPLTKRFEEEINDLHQEKAQIEQAIEEKNQALADSKEELAGLEVELQGPTEAELKSITLGTSAHDPTSTKHRASGISIITAIISTIFCVFLATYLFFFYASAVDKAFFLNTEAIQAQLAQGTYAGVNDVVNPRALFKAFQGEWNLFVVMFPFVFLAFAIVLDYFWEQKKWGYLVATVLAALTLIFDGILAIQISQKIHQAKILMGQETEQWRFRMNDLNMWTVIFCGFVVSLLVSITYHVMNQRWKAADPIQEKSEAENIRESEIKNEKTQRETRIAVLKAGMENSQNEIEHLKERERTTEEKIVKAVRTPIDSQIAILNVQTENLESEIEQFKSRDTNLQQKIDKTRSKIEELFGNFNKRVVNRNKMESQVNQFLNGWCRFVAHRGDGTSEVSDEIDRVKQVANDTLDLYYQGVPDYSD